MLKSWLLRLTLAALLLFGSEILLWNDPQSRTIFDWILLAIGYIALSSIVLDLGVRYRVRDVFGLMLLAGIYGLLNGAILNPQTGLLEVPRTLVTRVLGAHTLIGLGVLALFIHFGQVNRWTYHIIRIVAVAWGLWVRWISTLEDTVSAYVLLEPMLGYGLAFMSLIAVCSLLAKRFARNVTVDSLRLSKLEWGIVLLTLGLLWLRNTNQFDMFALTIVAVLTTFCVLLLWFQKRERGGTLFDSAVPIQVSVLFIIINIVGVVFLGLFGYVISSAIPGITADVLTVYVALFTAFGVVWLPTVSLVMGIRAYRKLTRQMQF